MRLIVNPAMPILPRCFILPLFLAIALVTANPVWAQQNRVESVYHFEMGNKLLAERKNDAATLEFVKALDEDVENFPAREKLATLFSQTKPQVSKIILQQQYFLELIDYIRFLSLRINELHAENESLVKIISQYPNHDNILEHAETLGKKMNQEIEHSISMRATWGTAQSNWVAFSESFTKRKAFLRSILSEVEALNHDLHVRRCKIYSLQKNKTINLQAQHLIERIKDLEMTRIRKNEMIEQQSKNISLLTEEIDVLRQQFANLQAKFDSAQRRTDDLGQNLAGTTLEIYQRDQLLANKEQQLKKIKDELVELRERGVLMQRIIQEKELRNLTEKEPTDYAARIQTLEQQFQELNRRYLVMEKNLTDRENEVVKLRQEVVTREDKILTLKNAFNSKDEKIGELLGVVEIYKSKLGESKKVMEGLDNRLDQFQSRANAASDIEQAGVEVSKKPVILKPGTGVYSLDDVIRQLSGDLPAMKAENP